MRQRRATTLVEVLVAIFVMGIGLLSLLALFPLAALNMAQSIKDDRAAHAAANARAFANFYYTLYTASGTTKAPFRIEYQNVQTAYWWFDATFTSGVAYPGSPPAYGNGLDYPPPVQPPTTPPGSPGYPVYIDPIGFQLVSSSADPRVGTGAPQTAIKRVTLSMFNKPTPQPPYTPGGPASALLPMRYFSMLDDCTFAGNGIPVPGDPAPFAPVPGPPPPYAANTPVERAGRYTWAYLVRETSHVPFTAPPAAPTYATEGGITVSIVVYDRRGLETVPSPVIAAAPPYGNFDTINGFQLAGENVYTAIFDPMVAGGNIVTINWNPPAVPGAPAEKPPVRKGTWILQASATTPSIAYFHRVVGVSEPQAGQMVLELQNPILVGDTSPGALAIVMEGVVEVFDLGTKR